MNIRKFKKGIISEATEIWMWAENTLMSDLQTAAVSKQTVCIPSVLCVAPQKVSTVIQT